MAGIVLALAGLTCEDGGPKAGVKAPATVSPEGKLEGPRALTGLDHLVLVVPSTWFAGRHPSSPPLRQSWVVALLGSPESTFTSGWRERWAYGRLGLWFEWECPVCYYCPADALGSVAMAVLRAQALGQALAILLEAHYMPAERLAEVGWSRWGLKRVWQWE